MKYDIEQLSPEEFNQIIQIFNYTKSPMVRLEMVHLRHERDLRFINNIRNQFYDPERQTPVMISTKQRTWFEFIYHRMTRGYYSHQNITFMFKPPSNLIEKFADIYSNEFLDELSPDDSP